MSLTSSLTNRIFLSTAILVTVAIGVAVDRVNRAVTTQAEDDLRGGVDQAAALVTDYVTARQKEFLIEATLVADFPPLTNAIALPPDDPDTVNTVQDVAREYANKLNPDLFLVLGRKDRVLARFGGLPATVVPTEAIIAARPTTGDPTWFWPYPGGLLVVTALPTGGASTSFGSLLAGFSLDRAAVETIKERTKTGSRSAADIVLLADGRVLATTLSADLAVKLPAYARKTGPFDVSLGPDDFMGLVQPLPSARVGTVDPPVAIVLRDRTERLAVLRDIQRAVLLESLAALLIATLIGYAIARTVTRPLRAVTATMGRMAATGDLTQPAPIEGRWDDEDARLLARTFRQMTTALDRFRREASQRERLSSLGRLSTVVAHEVRNPLMIIKSAVRTLRRQPAPEVGALAASIDEEVSRLNRVVTGVLDFARPIQFELAPADLADICRDAAQAAEAGPDEVRVTVEIADAPAPIVTDAERLRTVLVNVLSNAQQAVRAQSDRSVGVSPIRLRTERHAAAWRIEVTDRGAGIAREDLPRLFEPFFTTRRTGSGLGLALARNIVEGLGGSIGIESTPGVGTTVRIDLPERTVSQEVPA